MAFICIFLSLLIFWPIFARFSPIKIWSLPWVSWLNVTWCGLWIPRQVSFSKISNNYAVDRVSITTPIITPILQKYLNENKYKYFLSLPFLSFKTYYSRSINLPKKYQTKERKNVTALSDILSTFFLLSFFFTTKKNTDWPNWKMRDQFDKEQHY